MLVEHISRGITSIVLSSHFRSCLLYPALLSSLINYLYNQLASVSGLAHMKLRDPPKGTYCRGKIRVYCMSYSRPWTANVPNLPKPFSRLDKKR